MIVAKKGWIQKVNEQMEKKGTKGAFTEWCKKQGYEGVSQECIEKGKKSRNPTTRKRAQLAETFRKIAKKK